MKTIKLNLTVKILACVLIPIIVLMVFSILAIRDVGDLMSDQLQEEHLQTSIYAVEEMVDLVSTERFYLEGDELWRGSMV